jgi:hypothetical protein
MVRDTTRGHRRPRERLLWAGMLGAAVSAAVSLTACGGPASPG